MVKEVTIRNRIITLNNSNITNAVVSNIPKYHMNKNHCI